MNEHHLQEEIEFYEKHKFQDLLKPFQLRSVNENEVQVVLQKIHSGTVECDGMPIHLFKMIPDLCLKSLTDIVNCSIETKMFPNVWKMGLITPVPEMSQPVDYEDLRPVCLLSVLSKVLERLIFQQIISFLEDHKILFSVKIWSIRFLVFPSL
jgi:hypothetical protein